MAQNRKKLIDLFIGNISNSIIHKILEKAIDKEEISVKYSKELITSREIAKEYRKKINPVNSPLPDKDIEYVKNRIKNKVRSELMLRILKGYKNIDLGLIEELIDKDLREMKVI